MNSAIPFTLPTELLDVTRARLNLQGPPDGTWRVVRTKGIKNSKNQETIEGIKISVGEKGICYEKASIEPRSKFYKQDGSEYNWGLDGNKLHHALTYTVLPGNEDHNTMITLYIQHQERNPFHNAPYASAQLRLVDSGGRKDPENHVETQSYRRDLLLCQAWQNQVPLFYGTLGMAMLVQRHLVDGIATSESSIELSRSDLDITELLWSFAAYAIDENDVSNSIAKLVYALESQSISPFVAKSNTSSLAVLIRETLRLNALVTANDYEQQRRRVTEQFDYWIEYPCNCLAEIALFKMQRDYASELMSDGIFNHSQLEYFLDCSESPDVQLLRTVCLHRALEVSQFLKINLPQLEKSIVRSVINSIFSKFTKDLATCDIHADDIMLHTVEYECDLPQYAPSTMKLIDAIAKGVEPSSWTTTWERGNSRFAIRCSERDEFSSSSTEENTDDIANVGYYTMLSQCRMTNWYDPS